MNGYYYVAIGAVFFVLGVLSIKAGGDVLMTKTWRLGLAGIAFGLFLVVAFYWAVTHGMIIIDGR